MPTIEPSVEVARHLHRSGDFAGAEQMCRQVLAVSPPGSEGLGNLPSFYADVHNVLGKALIRQGKIEEGIASFSEAIRRHPQSAEGYFNLGRALDKEGHCEQAVECFRRCLSLEPTTVGAYYHLGKLLRKIKRPQEAVAFYQEGLRLLPHAADLHSGLASAYFMLGRMDEAIAHYEEVVRQKPDNPKALFDLAEAYRADNLAAESILCYERAVQIEPNSAWAHNNLGETLVSAGEPARAERHLREALRIYPNFLLTLCNLIQFGLAGCESPEIARIRELLVDPRVADEEKVLIHFTLGEVLDRWGRYDEAFAHFQRGNSLRRAELLRVGESFEPHEYQRRLEQAQACYTADYFQSVQRLGLDTDLPVFVVGVPRSGTTLVEQVLASHPQVFGAGELRDVNHLASDLGAILGSIQEDPANLSTVTAVAMRGAAERYVQKLCRRGRTARRVTDKMPGNFLHLGLIATLFPGARIIHCRRDPLDTCLSCYTSHFRGVNYAWDLEDLGAFYRGYEQLMGHWRAVLPMPIFDVVYEDLVANPERISREILEFCGLEWNERCLRFYEFQRSVQTLSHLQVRRPMYASSVGRWRHYAAHLEPLRKALAQPG
jgi:tetratricopeptide (TPR) repeat protein